MSSIDEIIMWHGDLLILVFSLKNQFYIVIGIMVFVEKSLYYILCTIFNYIKEFAMSSSSPPFSFSDSDSDFDSGLTKEQEEAIFDLGRRIQASCEAMQRQQPPAEEGLGSDSSNANDNGNDNKNYNQIYDLKINPR